MEAKKGHNASRSQPPASSSRHIEITSRQPPGTCHEQGMRPVTPVGPRDSELGEGLMERFLYEPASCSCRLHQCFRRHRLFHACSIELPGALARHSRHVHADTELAAVQRRTRSSGRIVGSFVIEPIASQRVSQANASRTVERGMVLPFQPLCLTFHHIKYLVALPKVASRNDLSRPECFCLALWRLQFSDCCRYSFLNFRGIKSYLISYPDGLHDI